MNTNGNVLHNKYDFFINTVQLIFLLGGAGAEIILWPDKGGAGGPFNFVLVPDISTKSSNGGARGGNVGGSGIGSGGGAQAKFDQNLPWLLENWASGKQFSDGLSGLFTNSKKQNPFPSSPVQPSPKMIKSWFGCFFPTKMFCSLFLFVYLVWMKKENMQENSEYIVRSFKFSCAAFPHLREFWNAFCRSFLYLFSIYIYTIVEPN